MIGPWWKLKFGRKPPLALRVPECSISLRAYLVHVVEEMEEWKFQNVTSSAEVWIQRTSLVHLISLWNEVHTCICICMYVETYIYMYIVQ